MTNYIYWFRPRSFEVSVSSLTGRRRKCIIKLYGKWYWYILTYNTYSIGRDVVGFCFLPMTGEPYAGLDSSRSFGFDFLSDCSFVVRPLSACLLACLTARRPVFAPLVPSRMISIIWHYFTRRTQECDFLYIFSSYILVCKTSGEAFVILAIGLCMERTVLVKQRHRACRLIVFSISRSFRFTKGKKKTRWDCGVSLDRLDRSAHCRFLYGLCVWVWV